MGARRKTIPIRNFGFGRANNASWGLGVPHHHASPSGNASAGTRNLAPLRRQLSTAATCWVVPNLRALVGQPTLNAGIDFDSGRSSNRTGGYWSRRTDAVKFVGLSQTSALTFGLARRLEFSLRTELDRWHTPGQAVTLLSRGCSSPQLPASIGGLDTWGLTSVKPHPVACALPAVSLSRNEGRPYLRLRCFIAGVSTGHL